MAQKAKENYQNRGRSLSRNLLGQDMDMLSKYASKYSSPNVYGMNGGGGPSTFKRTNTYTAAAMKQSYPAYGSGGGGYQHGYGYSSSSQGSQNSYGSNNSGAAQQYRKTPSNRRTTSNLIQPATASQWDDNTLNSQANDMQSAMQSMVTSYSTRINSQAKFLDEIQDSAENDEDFAKPERSDDWSVKEVCFWLTKIHLDKYITAFSNQIIDGSILLRDLDQHMLTNELGVKRLHVKKLIREIKKLKDVCPKLKQENKDSRDDLIKALKEEVEDLKAKNKYLSDEVRRLKSRAK